MYQKMSFKINFNIGGIADALKNLVSVGEQVIRSIEKGFFNTMRKHDPIEILCANRVAVKFEEEDAIFWWILSCYRGKYRRVNPIMNMSHSTAPSACRSVV